MFNLLLIIQNQINNNRLYFHIFCDTILISTYFILNLTPHNRFYFQGEQIKNGLN